MNKCPICSNKSELFISKYNIYKCQNCGFGFTLNLKAQSGDYYRDEDYIQEEALFKNIFLRRVNIISSFIQKGSVLEVGCSSGLMLSLLKNKGFTVMGCEPSNIAAKMAKKRGIEVKVGFFEKINFLTKFDVIIFNHTLEHLEDPRETLIKAHKLLRRGGVLYIDLPNFDSFSAKIFKSHWEQLLPNEHLWHFTEKSFKILLSDIGFKIIFVNKSSGVWDLQNPSSELLFALTNFKKRFFKEIITAIPSQVVSKLNQGSDLLVMSVKK